MTKRIVLHIGRHKTGTTALQKFMFRNSSFLESHGLYYPKAVYHRKFAHHDLVHDIRCFEHKYVPEIISAYRAKRQLAPFFDELSDKHVNILSSEAFQNMSPFLLAKVFKGFDVSVVVYLRNHFDYLASAYAQKVHATRYAGSMSDFANHFELSYVSFLNRWVAAFPEKLMVCLYDQKYLVNGCVVSDFLAKPLGLNKDDIGFSIATGNANVSLTRKVLEFKRYANEHLLSSISGTLSPYGFFASLAASDHSSGKVRVTEKLKSQLLVECESERAFVNEKFIPETPIDSYKSYSTQEPYQLTSEELNFFVGEFNRWLKINAA